MYIKVWRGYGARKWVWITAPRCAQIIQRNYRCRLAKLCLQKMNFDAGVVARTRSLDSENPEPMVLDGDRSSAQIGVHTEICTCGWWCTRMRCGAHSRHITIIYRYKALKRWKLASLTRCFTRWKTLVSLNKLYCTCTSNGKTALFWIPARILVDWVDALTSPCYHFLDSHLARQSWKRFASGQEYDTWWDIFMFPKVGSAYCILWRLSHDLAQLPWAAGGIIKGGTGAQYFA